VRQVKANLGRSRMSVRHYDIEHVPHIEGRTGGRRLRSMREAVTTVFHEVYHPESYRAFGHGGTEAQAETFGQRMFNVFRRRWF
jgi:hypothetical protein